MSYWQEGNQVLSLHSPALLLWRISALLPGYLPLHWLALLSGNTGALLLGHLLAVLAGHLGTLLPGSSTRDIRMIIMQVLTVFIPALLSWHIYTLLLRYLLALLSWHSAALLPWYCLALLSWHT